MAQFPRDSLPAMPTPSTPIVSTASGSLQFALLVLGGTGTQAQVSALNFARAALAGGHRILRVFFFSEGVTAGSAQTVPVPDSDAIAVQWSALAGAHAIDLVVCATSAVRRGVLDAGEAARYDRAVTLQPGFDISGLGQWVEACLLADRTVMFG
jgi:tRNA 2-thiouridine synthesizing protein D